MAAWPAKCRLIRRDDVLGFVSGRLEAAFRAQPNLLPNILATLDVTNRVEATAAALSLQLLPPKEVSGARATDDRRSRHATRMRHTEQSQSRSR
jgi:hypothetical protein